MKRVTLGLVLIYTIFVNGYAQLQKDKTTVRVLTFNILHGATTQNTFDLDTIASVIIAAQPDFVALQEVDFKTQRAHQYDLVTELG
jgi:endonuclease/exonuclease/phosphatase family metal-dependent hydrolase